MARIRPAENRRSPRPLILGRQTKMLPSALFKYMTAQIKLMTALHHNLPCRGLRIVERVDITVSHHSIVDLRIASDSASCTLCGSSHAASLCRSCSSCEREQNCDPVHRIPRPGRKMVNIAGG